MSIYQNTVGSKRCVVCGCEASPYMQHPGVGSFLKCRCGLIFQDPSEFIPEASTLSAGSAAELNPEDFQRTFSESIDTSDESGNMYADHGIQHQKMVDGICSELVATLTDHANFDFSRSFSVLDVGCATGFLLDALRKRFPAARVVGVEPSPVSGNKAKKLYGLDIHIGTMNTFPMPAAPFDLVTILGNLQLHENPFRTLAQAAQNLVDGGTLICQFKNPYCTARVLSRTMTKTPWVRRSKITRLMLERGFACMRHSGSKQSLKSAIETTGLKVIHTRTLPPRMAVYSDMAQAHASGIKGRIWKFLNHVDRIIDQQAWIEFVCRKPKATDAASVAG
jgi:SAM-dependent methyltransferase